jgi:peptidoglycan/xylan/chitin deacetylase (PgdA/CDA1 family)
MLCVSPAVFEEHLQFLTQQYDIVPLSVLQERLNTGTLHGTEAVITFDDGYVDNFTHAVPLLEKYSVPATIFVTTGYLGEPAQFSWDTEYQADDRAHFLSKEEIRLLAEHPLIEIGAHTHTHKRLSTLCSAEQRNELQQNKDILESITARPVTQFAYPFGGIFDYTKKTRAIAEEIGFEVLCTTDPKFVTPKSSPLHLTRFNIRSSSIDALAKTLLHTATN